jgi:hypothetical protein
MRNVVAGLMILTIASFMPPGHADDKSDVGPNVLRELQWIALAHINLPKQLIVVPQESADPACLENGMTRVYGRINKSRLRALAEVLVTTSKRGTYSSVHVKGNRALAYSGEYCGTDSARGDEIALYFERNTWVVKGRSYWVT